MDEKHVQVIELRGNGGLGVFLRVGDDQRLYRVAPVRDPSQPRFWCLAAFECSSCGIPVSGSAIWAGWWGSAQMELPAILDTIKADADAWLADDQCAKLRQILQQPRPPLQMPLARVTRHEAGNSPRRGARRRLPNGQADRPDVIVGADCAGGSIGKEAPVPEATASGEARFRPTRRKSGCAGRIQMPLPWTGR